MDAAEKQRIWQIQHLKEEHVRKSLSSSIKDAMSYGVMQGAGVNFINAFAIALKATNFQISLLSSVPQLIASWSQLFSSELLEKFKNRSKLIGIFVLFQALTWIPMLLLPFFFIGESAVWLLIIFFTVFQLFGAIVGPVWQSQMGDLVPMKERGAYFGKRNALAGTITLGATLLAGYWLNLYPKEMELLAFSALFFAAFWFRIISRYYLGRMFDPPFIPKPAVQFSFVQFAKKMRSNNFGNFVLYSSALSLAVNICSPFFAVYMLRNLGYDYLSFTLVTIAPMISGLLVMRYWGTITDIFGSRKIMQVCGIMVAIIPAYWMLFKDPLVLFLLQFFVSGFFWAGHNLASGNFIFDTTTPERRTRCAAYFNVFNGTGIFAGAIIGGILASSISESFFGLDALLWVFAISLIARLAVFLYFRSRIVEVRPVKEIKDRTLFYNVIVSNPISGFAFELFTTAYKTAGKPAKGIAKVPKIISKAIKDADSNASKTVGAIIKAADRIVKRKKQEKPAAQKQEKATPKPEKTVQKAQAQQKSSAQEQSQTQKNK